MYTTKNLDFRNVKKNRENVKNNYRLTDLNQSRLFDRNVLSEVIFRRKSLTTERESLSIMYGNI